MTDKPECHPRKRFASREAADAAARAINARTRADRTVERCKHCGGYHLK